MFTNRVEIPTNTAFFEFIREFGAADNQRQLETRIRATGGNQVTLRSNGTLLTLTLQPGGEVFIDDEFHQRTSREHPNKLSDDELAGMAQALRNFKSQGLLIG